jgi:hypothetical protein
MVRHHVAARDMTPIPDWETDARSTLKVSSPPSARRVYKMAWTAALLGFVLLILSFALNIYFWIRWTKIIYGDHDFDEIDRLSWLSSIAGITDMVGIVLMVASIVFMIRGLLAENDRQRAGTILFGTLKRLEWVTLIALMFYVLYLPMLTLIAFVLGSAYMLAYSSNPAFLFLAALPLIVANALHKAHP